MTRLHSIARSLRMSAILIAIVGATLDMPAAQEVTFTRADSLMGIHVVSATYGPTLGDYDADFRGDVFVTNHAACPSLFRNSDGSNFADELEGSNILRDADQHGAAWGDCNNDGLPDLYVAVGAEMGLGSGENELYRNLDGRHFEEIGAISGTNDPYGRGRFPYWIDVDSDGLLDLFVANMDTPNRLFLNQGRFEFTAAENAGGLGGSDLWYAGWSEVTGDAQMDVILSGPGSGRLVLYANDGAGRFTDITALSGLPHELYGVRSLCWFDYDNDGDQDLYISRGYFSCAQDALWYDDIEARMLMTLDPNPEHESGEDGNDVYAVAAGLNADIRADWDTDPRELIFLGANGVHPSNDPFALMDGQWLGSPSFTPGVDPGVFIWQDAPGGAWHFRASTDFAADHFYGILLRPIAGSISLVTRHDIETPTGAEVGDRLYCNTGGGHFVNVTAQAGISDDSDGRTAIAADFNNDGWLDLYVVSARNIVDYWAQNMPDLLYMNSGHGTFTECAAAAGLNEEVSGTGAGAGWDDFNSDGFPDLYVTNGWDCFPFCLGPHVVYLNNGGAKHWARVRLVGHDSNRDATGARVRLVAGGRAQFRVQSGGVTDMSQSTMDLHFGLGECETADSLVVWWPGSHAAEVFTGLAADQLHVIEQGAGQDVPAPIAAPFAIDLRPPAPMPAHAPLVFSYRLNAPASVRLEIYDCQGRLVRAIADGQRPAGVFSATWDGCDGSARGVASGMYYVRLRAGGAERSCTVTVVRD